MREYKEKVLIIGGDHHNTLAVIRGLAKENVPIEILVHGDFIKKSDIIISHSKFSKELFYVENNEEKIIEWLLKNVECNKKIIFPCSDFAMYVIDKNYDTLKQYYIIPGFKDNPGKVVCLMDKYEQKKWADKNNISMAKTWNCKINNGRFEIPEYIIYPCILKPQISALGEKSDIKVVKDYEEMRDALDIFSKKGYIEILIQQFLNKKYEICAYGCIEENKYQYHGAVIKKIREFPKNGGSATLAKFIEDEKLVEFAKNIILKLRNDGYRGMYDIECLVCDDRIYLNEINFRHSGNGYALIQNGINAPFIGYLDVIDERKDDEYKLNNPGGYLVNEYGEWSLFKTKNISLREMISDYRKVFAYSIWDKKDMWVAVFFIKSKIVNKIVNKIKKGNIKNGTK
jgi:predicted ATP-grasp superfamily ATP-dependent carboligase